MSEEQGKRECSAARPPWEGLGRAQKLLSKRFSGKQQKGKTEGNKQMGKAEDHGL